MSCVTIADKKPRLLVLDGAWDGLPAPIREALAGAYTIINTADVPDSELRKLIEAEADGAKATPLAAVLATPQAWAKSESDSGAPTELLSNLGHGACVTDAEGGLVWGDARYASLDEAVRARVADACRRGAGAMERRLTLGSVTEDIGRRYDVATEDGSRSFEVLISPVDIADAAAPGDKDAPPQRRINRVAAVIWEVTDARRVQKRMDAIDRAGAELVRLDAEAVRKMQAGERLQLLEDKIVAAAHDLLHFDHFTIRLLDERTGKLEMVIASGVPSEALELELTAADEGSGIIGRAAATGRCFICNDTAKQSQYISGYAGARSALTVPLRLNDKIIGVFNAESEQLDAFTEEDRQFAEMFVNHVALALHILDLLVIERCSTGETVSGAVQSELADPLDDIAEETTRLREQGDLPDSVRAGLERIQRDVESIRKRVGEAVSGPQHILGAERALTDLAICPVLAHKRVLVADDADRMRDTIGEILRARGAYVETVDCGQKAIDKLDAEGGRRYDLVVSDIKLPDRNGYQVFSAAKRSREDLPVILMTGFGYDPHHSIVRASQEGLECVLFKPFPADRLLEEARKALGKRDDD